MTNRMHIGAVSSGENISASAVAAMQRLNTRVCDLDAAVRSHVHQLKLNLTKALSRSGYCVSSHLTRGRRGPICKTTYQLGQQTFRWAVPASKLDFRVKVKSPVKSYKGVPADLDAIAQTDTADLLNEVYSAFSQPEPATQAEVSGLNRDDEWQLNYLEEYIEQHRRWPQTATEYPCGNHLGQVVVQWRTRYRVGKLPWEIVTRLNRLGISWNAKSRSWFEQFFKVREFRAANRRWPRQCKGCSELERELAAWLSLQRTMHKQGTLLPERKALLDTLNFDWKGYSEKQERYA